MVFVTDMILKVHNDNRSVAINAAIDLVQGLDLESLEELIVLVVPSKEVPTEIFDICCDAFTIVEEMRQHELKIPNEPPKAHS